MFVEELHSATLACAANHVAVIDIDPTYRLFVLTYNWLNLESNMLEALGVFSLQNFWYLLKETWIHGIKMQFGSSGSCSTYIRHIITGNNGDWENISIATEDEQIAFFHTLCVVFNITICLHFLMGTACNTRNINICPTATQVKIINVRKSVQGNYIFEPWINPESVGSISQVCKNFSVAIY